MQCAQEIKQEQVDPRQFVPVKQEPEEFETPRFIIPGENEPEPGQGLKNAILARMVEKAAEEFGPAKIKPVTPFYRSDTIPSVVILTKRGRPISPRGPLHLRNGARVASCRKCKKSWTVTNRHDLQSIDCPSCNEKAPIRAFVLEKDCSHCGLEILSKARKPGIGCDDSGCERRFHDHCVNDFMGPDLKLAGYFGQKAARPDPAGIYFKNKAYRGRPFTCPLCIAKNKRDQLSSHVSAKNE